MICEVIFMVSSENIRVKCANGERYEKNICI